MSIFSWFYGPAGVRQVIAALNNMNLIEASPVELYSFDIEATDCEAELKTNEKN